MTQKAVPLEALSEDSQLSDSQYDVEVIAKDNNSTLIINVRDRRNLRKFTNSYNPTSLAAKGLTQSIDKLQKLLKTASKNDKENWSMQYGYFTNPNHGKSSSKKQDQIDLLPSYLSKSELSSIRKKPKLHDTFFIILAINEDFFSVDTQFKLYEIERSSKKAKSRRTLSNTSKPGTPSRSHGMFDYDDQKIADMEAKIKSLTRDNQVLKRKIEKLESVSGKKQKKMDSEREMRLQANKERFWLKQKLERLQKAISARLKILGVDFSKVDDITAALDMAFNVIQKLAKELQQKEEEFEEMRDKMNNALDEAKQHRKAKDALDATIEKQRGVMSDLRKQLMDKNRRLSIVAHEKNDNESMLMKQLQDLQNETDQIRKDKENIYNKMVDEKAKLKGEIDDKLKEIQDLKNKLNKIKEQNDKLLNENEQIKEENDKLLNNNNDLNGKLQEAIKEIDELKNELESEKNKNNLLIDKNKKLKQEIKKLLNDLMRLKELLEKALNFETKLKNVLDDTNDLVVNITNNDISQLIHDDDHDDDDDDDDDD